jgi:peptidoglycan hydrolase CwlO-like protein
MEKEMNEIDILKMNVNELQGQLQNAYKRIDQLQELIEVERQTNEEASTSDPIILTE